MEGKPLTESRPECCDSIGLGGHPCQPCAHAVAYPMWQPVFDQHGASIFNRDDVVVLEAAEKFHDKERVPLHSVCPLQEISVGFRSENVDRDLCDGLMRE